jgi:hypothetical protein
VSIETVDEKLFFLLHITKHAHYTSIKTDCNQNVTTASNA